jgi:hypothetical protein
VVCQDWSPDIDIIFASHPKLQACHLSLGSLDFTTSSLASVRIHCQDLQHLGIRSPLLQLAIYRGRLSTPSLRGIGVVAKEVALIQSLVQLDLTFAPTKWPAHHQLMVATKVIDALRTEHGNAKHLTPFALACIYLIERKSSQHWIGGTSG